MLMLVSIKQASVGVEKREDSVKEGSIVEVGAGRAL